MTITIKNLGKKYSHITQVLHVAGLGNFPYEIYGKCTTLIKLRILLVKLLVYTVSPVKYLPASIMQCSLFVYISTSC